jgi:ABC-2 type transport system permease protein
VNGFGLMLHQTRYDLIGFVRDPRARFFTVALPVLFLVLFASVFSGGHTTVAGTRVSTAGYYVPHLMTLGVVAAGLVNLAIVIVDQRESGSLVRRRATPVPAWVLIAGRAATAVAAALSVDVVLLVVGRLAYHVPTPAGGLAPLLVATVVGTTSLACLAYALSGLIPSADAAQPVVQAVVLPLYFVSGIFVPDASLPAEVRDAAKVFPVEWLARAMQTAFFGGGERWAWSALGVVAAWGAAGLAVALARFAWFPKTA